jgi:metal-sulfur cluster biosynthetic enzyme
MQPMPIGREQIVDALRRVYDPCCEDRGISIVDMGVLEDVRISDDGQVEVDLVLTTGWCPFVASMSDRIPERLSEDFGLTNIKVNTLWDPVWTMDRLSPDARSKLSLDLSPLIPYREQRLAAEISPATEEVGP